VAEYSEPVYVQSALFTAAERPSTPESRNIKELGISTENLRLYIDNVGFLKPR